MKRLYSSILCLLVCTLCGPYVTLKAQHTSSPTESNQQTTQSQQVQPTAQSQQPQQIQHPSHPSPERQAYHQKMQSMTHEERIAHRAERQAEFEKYLDSVVLSHNFEFNPQSAQMLPAGTMLFLSNPNYTVTLWRNSLDVCLPYWVGYTPPYRYVLLNTVTPNIGTIVTKQTDEGWSVSFRVNLYATDEYTFTFDINTRYGGATLTISNVWYNPVQYTGTITRVY